MDMQEIKLKLKASKSSSYQNVLILLWKQVENLHDNSVESITRI
jgi:hypothetical protein